MGVWDSPVPFLFPSPLSLCLFQGRACLLLLPSLGLRTLSHPVALQREFLRKTIPYTELPCSWDPERPRGLGGGEKSWGSVGSQDCPALTALSHPPTCAVHSPKEPQFLTCR